MAINTLLLGTYILMNIIVSCTTLEKAEGTHDLVGGGENKSSSLPCPDPSVITPCSCYVDSNGMAMDCSAVESDEMLWTIFHQSFPFNDFYYLKIEFNKGLTSLKEGIFGDVTFGFIEVCFTKISVVEPGALLGSKHTATGLKFNDNLQLTSFVFHDIQFFDKLYSLNLRNSNINQIPPFMSATLAYLYLDGNPIKTFEPHTFDNLTNLVTLTHILGHLTQIHTGSFNSPKLNYLDLKVNGLTSLPKGAITFYEEESWVNLWHNRISNVSEGAITGAGGIEISLNDLTELTEEVWKPILTHGGKIHAYENPLLCGCEIAWLILNPDLLAKMSGDETCYDGVLLTDLDPAMYEELC